MGEFEKTNQNTSPILPQTVDFFARYAWESLLQKLVYPDDRHSIFHEIIINSHINTCHKVENCFCRNVSEVKLQNKPFTLFHSLFSF